MWCTCSELTFAWSARVQRSRQSPHPAPPAHSDREYQHTCPAPAPPTSFLAPKLLEGCEEEERGSRRAAERGSAAADTERGSCRGSSGGGADALSFDPLAPASLPFFVTEAVSTDCVCVCVCVCVCELRV